MACSLTCSIICIEHTPQTDPCLFALDFEVLILLGYFLGFGLLPSVTDAAYLTTCFLILLFILFVCFSRFRWLSGFPDSSPLYLLLYPFPQRFTGFPVNVEARAYVLQNHISYSYFFHRDLHRLSPVTADQSPRYESTGRQNKKKYILAYTSIY